MPTNHPRPLLQVRSSSKANKLQRLGQDIQDAVIDLWHHPLVAQATLHAASKPVVLHLQVLIDIPTLKSRYQSDKQAALNTLCAWLKTNGVTYEIGYLPPQPTAIDLVQRKNQPTHQLVLSVSLPTQH